MAKRTWVDRAAESGDWMSAENKAASALQKSGARLRQARAAPDEPESEGLMTASQAARYLNCWRENLAFALPDRWSDDGNHLWHRATLDAARPVIAAYQREQKQLRAAQKALAGLSKRELEAWAGQVARAEQRELERQRLEAEERKYRAWTDDEADYQHNWVEIDYQNGGWHDDYGPFPSHRPDPRWARISKPPGPPRDPPPERDSEWSPPSRDALWKYEHRGFMTSLAGARSLGRPRKANKLTRAEIQKRYRDRQRRDPK